MAVKKKDPMQDLMTKIQSIDVSVFGSSTNRAAFNCEPETPWDTKTALCRLDILESLVRDVESKLSRIETVKVENGVSNAISDSISKANEAVGLVDKGNSELLKWNLELIQLKKVWEIEVAEAALS